MKLASSALRRQNSTGTCCLSSTSAWPRNGVCPLSRKNAPNMAARRELAGFRAFGPCSTLKKYFKLVILSNVDNESFHHSNQRLQVQFDAIYTAQRTSDTV